MSILGSEVVNFDNQRTIRIDRRECTLQIGEPIQPVVMETDSHLGNVCCNDIQAQVSKQVGKRGQATAGNPDRPPALCLHALGYLWQLLNWDASGFQIPRTISWFLTCD